MSQAENVVAFLFYALAASSLVLAPINDLGSEVDDLMTEEDFMLAAEKLQPNSSAGILVFENVWATRLRDAIVNANGRLVENARIPVAMVEAAMEAALSGAN